MVSAGCSESHREIVEAATGCPWRDEMVRAVFFQGAAAIVLREGFEDFVDGIGFVAHGPRARREGAPACAAAVKRHALKFLLPRALLYEASAVAMRAAFGRFDRGWSRVRRSERAIERDRFD